MSLIYGVSVAQRLRIAVELAFLRDAVCSQCAESVSLALLSHSRSAASSRIYADTNSLPLRRRRLPAGKSIPLATRIFPWCSTSPKSQQASSSEIRAGYRGSDRKFLCSLLISRHRYGRYSENHSCAASGARLPRFGFDRSSHPVSSTGAIDFSSTVSSKIVRVTARFPRQLRISAMSANLVAHRSPPLISSSALSSARLVAALVFASERPCTIRRQVATK